MLAGEKGVVRDQPFPPDDALLIHQEERPPCSRIRSMLDHHTAVLQGANLVWPKDAVIPDSLQVREVAEERVRELKRLRKRSLCEGMVSADPENLHVQVPEPAMIDLPGRQVLASRWGLADVELDENQLFPPELAQADLLPRRAGKCKVRRLLPDLQGCGRAGSNQYAGQQHAQQQPTSRELRQSAHLSISL